MLPSATRRRLSGDHQYTSTGYDRNYGVGCSENQPEFEFHVLRLCNSFVETDVRGDAGRWRSGVETTVRPIIGQCQHLAVNCAVSNLYRFKLRSCFCSGFYMPTAYCNAGCVLPQPILPVKYNTLNASLGRLFAFALPQWKHSGSN